jgi:peroxiredoxin
VKSRRVVFIVAAVLASQTPATAAPDFTLATLAGDTVTLASMKGRPVFLNFWATWCKPCRAEMTDIISAYGAHTEQHLVVLAINLTDQERMRDVRQFVTELQMPFPVLLDRKGKVRKGYRLRGVPTSVFIDTLGVVRFVNPGPITPQTMERGLRMILPGGEP